MNRRIAFGLAALATVCGWQEARSAGAERPNVIAFLKTILVCLCVALPCSAAVAVSASRAEMSTPHQLSGADWRIHEDAEIPVQDQWPIVGLTNEVLRPEAVTSTASAGATARSSVSQRP